VAPFHPLRYEARAFAARALAGLAVFCTIAIVLLAGSAPGQTATAEAKKDRGPWNGSERWNGGGHDQVQTDVDVSADPGTVPEQQGNTQFEDEGPWWRGGGGKEDPPDPPEPEGPPTSTTPTPTPDPAPAPDDGGNPGRPGDENEEPVPTGGGKGDPTEPEPEPQVNNPPSTPTEPTNPGNEGPTGTPIPEPTAVPLETEGQGAGRPKRIRFSRPGEAASNDPTSVAGVGGTEAEFLPAPAVGAPAFERVGRAEGGGDGSANPNDRLGQADPAAETGPPIIREIPRFVNNVPTALKAALAVLGVLSFLLAFAYLLTTMRARQLDRQRRELLTEVGLLQSALLPPVPDRVGGLRTSVAYRPADGPGAGGDFYDVLPLPGGRVGFILGDVSGHGRGALARTAFMRYTLRAYLEAGLEPRVALQVAGRVIDENLGGDFATVLLAVHDPETGSLTYATAGHPAPLVVGPQPHEPVTAGSSPPIGVGVRTGLRQTTVPLVSGSVAAMFTDGLLEARTEGGLLGRERLAELLEELGDDATARGLVDSVNNVSRVMSDDIAAVVIQPTNAATAGLFRTEQLELTSRELDSEIAHRFLEACGVAPADIESALYDARMISDRFGGVILHVVFGNRLRVEVLPRNVESIEAASRRAAAAR
jgi:hypothetical protein